MSWDGAEIARKGSQLDLPATYQDEILSSFEFDGWMTDWKAKGHQVWRLGMIYCSELKPGHYCKHQRYSDGDVTRPSAEAPAKTDIDDVANDQYCGEDHNRQIGEHGYRCGSNAYSIKNEFVQGVCAHKTEG